MEDTGFQDERSHREDEDRLQLLSREELEAQVRQRTSDLSNVMDTMVDVLMKLDPEGRVTMVNDAVSDILGYEEETIVDKPVDVLFASPEENEELADMTTSGRLIERLLSEGQVNDVEVNFSTASGEAIPMSLSASVMESEDGRLDGIVCVAKDISERKEAEQRAEFLHSLLRHDLGNKLQVTQGYLELLRDGDLDEREQEFLEDSLNSIDEATELIENVRMLNQIDGTETLAPVDLGAVVFEAVERHDDLRKQQDMTIDVDIDRGTTVLAGSLLKELFSNLLENALVHSGGSRIEIHGWSEGDIVTVVHEDDGNGIPPDKREKILQKGYSGAGSSGSGLGMHLVRQIARTYGGDIEVTASDLGGARFNITLQRATGT
jgi:PAS domain S-box-containing protein